MQITPANAFSIYQRVASSIVVAQEMGITRRKSVALLKLAGVDMSQKTLEQLHPRPDNAQELFDECGSSRAFGAKYGYSQRHANTILKMWGVRITSNGHKEAEDKARRIWCAELEKSCVLYGQKNCNFCKTSYYTYRRKS